MRNSLPSPKEAEERLDQAKQWGYSVFKEALGKFCDEGSFKLFVSVLLVLLIFVCSVVIVPISIYIYTGKNKRAGKFHKAVRFYQGRASTSAMDI